MVLKVNLVKDHHLLITIKIQNNSVYKINIFHICGMRIAVNARLLLKNKLEGIGWHAYELVSRLVLLCPEDQFILFYDRKDGILVPHGANVEVKILKPVTRHPLLLWYWTEVYLKAAIKKCKAEVFYSPEPILPHGLKIKSIITIHDISPKILPTSLPFSHRKYYNYILARNIKNADHIITVSHFSKQEIIKHYTVNAATLSVIYNAARKIFKPLPECEKVEIRKKYTGGERYFIYLGSINERKNVDKIIKSFDLFKGTSKTGHKLILVGKRMGKFEKVNTAMTHCHFNNDIIEMGYVEDGLAARLLASADALINLSEYEGFGMPLVEAMQSGVPVLAAANSCFPEIIQDAGKLTSQSDVNQIAQDMFFVFQYPDQLIQKGLKRSSEFNWDTSAKLLCTIINI